MSSRSKLIPQSLHKISDLFSFDLSKISCKYIDKYFEENWGWTKRKSPDLDFE